jgi:predicted nucleic acid-binding protein
MPYVNWKPGTVIAPPVYLDANILVGFVVRNHPLYRQTAGLVAELLAGQSSLYVSLLTVQESLWAIARLSYYELAHQRPDQHFSQSIYNRWRERIFKAHSARFTAVGSMLQAWEESGVPVEVVPKSETQLWRILDLTPRYMRQHRLTPADATHLALAQTHARTFATADTKLARVINNADLGDEFVVLHLTA